MRIIYDIEIKKAIAPAKNRIHGIEYCAGWHDHENMGISCLAAMDMDNHRPYLFMEDNLNEFKILASRADLLIGYNNIHFDNQVIRKGYDIQILDEKCYDLLAEIWRAAGLGTKWAGSHYNGYGLDDVYQAQAGKKGKTGHGAHAPIDFQNKNYGNLINYCLGDVWLEWWLAKMVETFGCLTDPKTGKTLHVRTPDKPTELEPS